VRACVRACVSQSVHPSLRAYDARNTKRIIGRTSASACVRACVFPFDFLLSSPRSRVSPFLSPPPPSFFLYLSLSFSFSIGCSVYSDRSTVCSDFLIHARPLLFATSIPEKFVATPASRHLSQLPLHTSNRYRRAVLTIAIQRGYGGGGDGGGGGGGGGGGSGGGGGGSGDKRRRVATQCHLLDSRESSGWSVVERERCARMSERAA